MFIYYYQSEEKKYITGILINIQCPQKKNNSSNVVTTPTNKNPSIDVNPTNKNVKDEINDNLETFELHKCGSTQRETSYIMSNLDPFLMHQILSITCIVLVF